MKKTAVIVVLLLVCVCLPARGEENALTTPGAVTAPAGTGQGASKTAAVVDGRAITVAEVTLWVRLEGEDPEKATPEQWRDALGAAINRALMLNAARDAKIEVTDDDAAKEVAERRKGPEGAEYRTRVETLGLNEEEEKRRMRDQLMIEGLLSKRLGTKLLVTPKMTAEWYAKNSGLLASPEKRTARVITLRDADRKAARARMEQVRGYVLAGADFAAVAKKDSQDPWAEQGGLLPEITKGSGSVFEGAVFGLAKVGDMSDVFETDAGVHVVRLDSVTPAVAPPLETVEGTVRQRILEELRAKFIPEVVAELRRRATVRIFWENIEGIR